MERPIEKVLAYGATGSQGSPVERRLLEAGFAVRVVTRNPEGPAWLGEAGAEVVAGDLGDAGSLRGASGGMDAVFVLVPFFNREADGGSGTGGTPSTRLGRPG